jgi:hypothetical protein
MSTRVKLGQLKRLSVRSVWPTEARHFTPWLAENIAALGAAIGMDLELVETEAPVGEYSADLVATDLGTGRPVVIENQFGATDHDHLGKLIAYASGVDAPTVIWVAESIRDEHRQALDWLNQRTDSDTQFFGLVLEVLQIDDSQPAFNLKPVVFPNEWQKTRHSVGDKAVSDRASAFRAYFQELIDDLRVKHRFTGARVGQPQNWYSFASGFSGVTYGHAFAQGGRARVELYIDRGDGAVNKAMFDWLHERREMIEGAVGEALEWERMDDRRASRIALYRPGTIDQGKDALASIHQWAIERLLKFRGAVHPLIAEYDRAD